MVIFHGKSLIKNILDYCIIRCLISGIFDVQLESTVKNKERKHLWVCFYQGHSPDVQLQGKTVGAH